MAKTEKKEMIGHCLYCGQEVMVEAESDSLAVGDAILDRTIEAANIKVADTIVSISASKSGCKMSRKRAISISSEI